jgi:hypothetical protein
MSARLDDELIQARLRGLPPVDVPLAEGWSDVCRRVERTESTARNRRRLASFAAAASLASLALLVGLRLVPDGGGQRAVDAGTAAVSVAPDEVAELQDRSRVLEAVLAGLPDRPAVARAGTALPIDELQAQVQWIDHQLTLATATTVADAASEQLWRERVATMNSLVQLRYLEAQRAAL